MSAQREFVLRPRVTSHESPPSVRPPQIRWRRSDAMRRVADKLCRHHLSAVWKRAARNEERHISRLVLRRWQNDGRNVQTGNFFAAMRALRHQNRSFRGWSLFRWVLIAHRGCRSGHRAMFRPESARHPAAIAPASTGFGRDFQKKMWPSPTSA